jgi:hypothetical protein
MEAPEKIRVAEHMARAWTRAERWTFGSWEHNLVVACAVVGGFLVPTPMLLLGLIWCLGALGSTSDGAAMFAFGSTVLLPAGVLLGLGVIAFQDTNSLQQVETAPDRGRIAATIVTVTGLVVGGAVVLFTGAFIIALFLVLAGALSDSR